MVRVKEDLTGRAFERLRVIEQADDYVSPNGKHYAQWKCKCCCGSNKTVVVTGAQLKSGHTKSCGCLMIEINTANGHKNKKYNQYDISGEFGIGLTSNTNKEFYFDLEDYNKIKDYCWYEHILGKYHVLEAHTLDDSIVRMHWLIAGKDYDHIDRNPLNNKRDNLRKATDSENNRNHSLRNNNTSGITGVGWDKKAINGLREYQLTAYIHTLDTLTIRKMLLKPDLMQRRSITKNLLHSYIYLKHMAF